MYNNSLAAGTVLKGRSYSYEIVKTLGQGSFGITYLAKVRMEGSLGSIGSNMFVAVKEFFMKEINGREGTSVTSGSKGGLFADYRRKFVREAATLSKLNHPNIVNVLESFEANNTCYYVMEYIDGGSLDEMIVRHHGLSEKETVDYTIQIAGALAFMHNNRMLHLDLKPQNIMLRNGHAVLIDFGLSKQYDESGEPESSTTVGGGTPGYAPLEQANHRYGNGFPVTMDVYALGATMFKMLTGERAPEASSILNDGFPRYKLEERGVDGRIVEIVEKAMMPMKKRRIQSVEILSKLLKDNASGVSSESDDGTVIDDVDIDFGNNGSDAGKTKNVRELIETLETQGSYKEAYNQCLVNIRNNVDLEYSKNKAAALVLLMKKKTKRNNIWALVFFIVVSIVCIFISAFAYSL